MPYLEVVLAAQRSKQKSVQDRLVVGHQHQVAVCGVVFFALKIMWGGDIDGCSLGACNQARACAFTAQLAVADIVVKLMPVAEACERWTYLDSDIEEWQTAKVA